MQREPITALAQRYHTSEFSNHSNDDSGYIGRHLHNCKRWGPQFQT